MLLFFQQPSHSVRFLVPFFPQSSVQFVEIAVFSSVCSCENAHMSIRCSRGFFFIFFWAELSCTQDEFLHDATWGNLKNATYILNKNKINVRLDYC